MEKRVIFAIALSLLILLSWSALVSKTQPVDNKVVTTQAISTPAAKEASRMVAPASLQQEVPESSLLTLPHREYDIIFIEPQASIKEAIFKQYQSSTFSLYNGFAILNEKLNFKKQNTNIAGNELVFVHKDENKRIIKRFILHNINYGIDLEIEIENLSSTLLSLDMPLALGRLNFKGDQYEVRFQDVTVSLPDKVLHANPRKDAVFENVKFVSLRNRYFCAILQPAGKTNNYGGYIKKIDSHISEIGLLVPKQELAAGQKATLKFRIYLGPQELRIINQVNSQWSAVMYYGTFDLIAQLLLQAMEFIHGVVRNWGVVIIILSLLIYVLLYPLTLKQMRSMKEMQLVQPKVEELRKMYKDNPQKLNKEIMELYREHKINPLGGCLPLILQIPVFFALYQVLIRSISLKGAKFLWIKDLSVPDRLFTLPFSLPVLGNEVNILPLVMAAGMFIQQKLSMGASGSASKEQQKLMTILFPVMFGIIFYRMPSGLVLYWFVNSLLMLQYQLRMHRKK